MNKCFDFYRSFEVPLNDLTREYESIGSEVERVISSVLKKSWYVLGDEVENFEKEFSKYNNVKHAVGVASGLDAMLLTLKAWGVKEGDEVITVSNSFIATAFAISQLGAEPVFVDVNLNNASMNVDLLEAKITEKTKVIMPVLLYGIVPDLETINRLAKKYNLKVLYDAAQAHGALYKAKPIAEYADATAFSFHPIKNLGSYGQGGAVLTYDDDLALILSQLRNYGAKEKNDYVHIGFNSRLDELQAAVLTLKLKHLDSWLARRREISKQYHDALQNLPMIKTFDFDIEESSSYSFVIRVLDNRRDELKSFLANKGISTTILYPKPIHMQDCYQNLKFNDLPNTELLSKEILSLPISPFHSEAEIEKVIATISSSF